MYYFKCFKAIKKNTYTHKTSNYDFFCYYIPDNCLFYNITLTPIMLVLSSCKKVDLLTMSCCELQIFAFQFKMSAKNYDVFLAFKMLKLKLKATGKNLHTTVISLY